MRERQEEARSGHLHECKGGMDWRSTKPLHGNGVDLEPWLSVSTSEWKTFSPGTSSGAGGSRNLTPEVKQKPHHTLATACCAAAFRARFHSRRCPTSALSALLSASSCAMRPS